MDDLGAALDTIEGLQVFPYWANRITPPAAVVGWPEPLTYDATYRRGTDSLTIPVSVLVGRVDARSSRDLLARYLDGAGPYSVKAVIDGHAGTAYSTAVVRSATVEAVTVASVEYLAATFEVDITGAGTA